MKNILIVCLIFFGTACGKKEGSSSKKRRDVKISKDQIQLIMEHQYFECAPTTDTDEASDKICPSGIARLFMLDVYEPEKSGVCTGFMVNETTLVTNNHCVKDQNVCNDTYIAVYNGEGQEYLQTKCKKVIAKGFDSEESNDPEKKLDFTVLEIDGIYSHAPLKITTNQVSDDEIVSLWVVDHVGLDRPDGGNFSESRITELRCHVDLESERAALTLRKCPVIHGNSGSPIMNSYDEVIGVVWGGTNTDDSSQDLDTRRESFFDFALGTLSLYFLPYL